MKKIFNLLAIILAFCSQRAYSQDLQKIDFYKQIQNYDIAPIIMCDAFIDEDREGYDEKIIRSEPIGFIGDDYQRFYIHFLSVKQNPKNKYEYFATGKTKVKDIARSFNGTITFQKAVIGKAEDFPNYQQGFATCDVKLYEDKQLSATGVFSGKMTVGYIIDPKKRFRYDGLMYYAD